MGGGTSKGKLSKQLRSTAADNRVWSYWCHFRANEEYDAGNYWEAAKWEARGDAADAEAAAADAAAAAAEAAGL